MCTSGSNSNLATDKEKSAPLVSVIIRVVIAVLVGAGLFWMSLENTLLFHTFAEIFSIIVAGSIFALVWNARRILDNGSLLFIGIAFFAVGFVDLLHTLAYKDMNVFANVGTNVATQLWIGGRAMQAIAFLLAPLLARRRLNAYGILLAWLAVGGLVLISIFVWPVFPVCHDGAQLTPFKKTAEYVICVVMAAAAVFFWARRKAYNGKLLRLLIASVLTMIVAELMFTRYAGVFDLSNVIGHFFKIVAFYLMYEAVIATGLLQPYTVLFRNLKKNEEALAVLRDKLEARVVERTAQLDRTARDLRVTNRLLQLYTIKHTRKEYLDAAVQILSEVSLCRCVGIRLRDNRGHIPYEAQIGFSKEFLSLEQDLSLDEVCVCARIFNGNPVESDRAGLTKDGGMYSADFGGFFDAVPDKRHYRGVCARCGYKSVGVAQIRYGDEAIGLIHVADTERNRIPDGMVALIESVAPLIGEAVHRFNVEAEVRALNAHLEKRVEERTLELAQRAVDLEAANKELETFSYTVSHDLRAPLRAIGGFTRILQEDHAPKLGDEGLRLLNVIDQNATRMGHLIDDLLDFARIHRQGLSITQVDMTELVRETWNELAPLRKDRVFRLVLDELPSARGDRAMLRQVFANLLTNAIKFTTPRPHALVHVAGVHDHGQIFYSVKDNGVGFDMKQSSKMFRVFSRLHRADEFEGTGVGLAIVKHIIDRHGGRIGAEAEPEQGARLWFSLPELPGVEQTNEESSVQTALVNKEA